MRIIEGELLSLARRKSIEDLFVLETLILYVSMGKKFSKLKGKDISYLRIANNRSKRTLISREEKIDQGRNNRRSFLETLILYVSKGKEIFET